MQAEYRPKLQPGPQKMVRWMEGSVFTCMAIVIMSGLLAMYGAQKTFDRFDGNCIYTSNISFISRTEGAETIATPRSASNPSERVRRETPTTDVTPINVSIESTVQPKEDRKFRAKKLKHIFKILESTQADEADDTIEKIESVPSRDIHLPRKIVRSDDDYLFLTKMQVDVVRTIWGNFGFCDYILYGLVLSTIVGMLCTTMLILYNTAGIANLDWGIPKPWRIVFPAAICFGIMTVAAAVHSVNTINAYKEFCIGLGSNLTSKSISCRIMMTALQPLVNPEWMGAGDFYLLHIANTHLTLAAWLIAFLIMIARMFFAIDFRLVRVTVSAFPQNSNTPSTDNSSSESGEVEQKAEHLDENAPKLLDVKTDRSVSSREDIDEYQSAHSDPDGAAAEPTSQERLLPNETQTKI